MYLVLTADPNAMQSKADVADMWTAVHAERDDFSFVTMHLKKTILPADYRIDVELDFAQLPHQLLPWARLKPMLKRLEPGALALAYNAKLAVSFRSRSLTLPLNNHLRLVGAAVLRTAERYNGIVLDLLARRAYTPASFRSLIGQDAETLGTPVMTRRRLGNQRFVLLSRGQIKFGLPDFVIGPFAKNQPRVSPGLVRRVRADLKTRRATIGRMIEYDGKSWTYTNCPKWSYDGECRYLTVAGEHP